MKALDRYSLLVLFMLLLKRVYFLEFFKTYLDRNMAVMALSYGSVK